MTFISDIVLWSRTCYVFLKDFMRIHVRSEHVCIRVPVLKKIDPVKTRLHETWCVPWSYSFDDSLIFENTSLVPLILDANLESRFAKLSGIGSKRIYLDVR